MHDLAFLAATGADLPDAVTVEALPPGVDADEVSASQLPVPHRGDADEAGLRMSVAGFQLKLSMLVDADGKGLTLAGEGRLGGHLVKLPARGYRAVPENEWATMCWAAAAGIDVPDVDLVALQDLPLPDGLPIAPGGAAFVIARFDRDGSGARVHIEDLNQVVGAWPRDKYDGVSYEDLGALVLRVTESEDDLWEYVRRLVFVVAAGNEEAHKKNWSLRYADGRRARLSPAYDLVSTVQYQDLTRTMALRLDRSKAFTDVGARSFDRLARRVGVDEAAMRAAVRDAADRTMATLADHLDDMPYPERLQAHLAGVPLLAP